MRILRKLDKTSWTFCIYKYTPLLFFSHPTLIESRNYLSCHSFSFFLKFQFIKIRFFSVFFEQDISFVFKHIRFL